MAIKTTRGKVLDAIARYNPDLIFNCHNCSHQWLPPRLREMDVLVPGLKDTDLVTCATVSKLGSFSMAETKFNGKSVVCLNIYTRFKYESRNTDDVTYLAIALNKLKGALVNKEILIIMPPHSNIIRMKHKLEINLSGNSVTLLSQ